MEYGRFRMKDGRLMVFNKLKKQDLPERARERVNGELVGGASIEPGQGKAGHVAYARA